VAGGGARIGALMRFMGCVERCERWKGWRARGVWRCYERPIGMGWVLEIRVGF
jgi:hypothetical protein